MTPRHWIVLSVAAAIWGGFACGGGGGSRTPGEMPGTGGAAGVRGGNGGSVGGGGNDARVAGRGGGGSGGGGEGIAGASGSGGRGSGRGGDAGTMAATGGMAAGGSGGSDQPRDGGVGATDGSPGDVGGDARATDLGGSGGGSGSGDAATDAAAAQELVHYYGRWNRLADRSIAVNSGSHVVARFTGTGVSARFDVTLNQAPAPTLTWRIDQLPWQEGELAPTMVLGAGLPVGPHEVLLMIRGLNELQNRWTPPLVSSITFLGFEVAGGALQPSNRPQRPRLEILGDSITEGIFVWGVRPGKDTPCWRADARLAYSSLTAQALGAEWRQVGFGKQGVLVTGNGGVPPASDAFDWIYGGVPRDAWQPDLVIVNQGTVDRTATAAAFRPAFSTYIGRVRAGYPNATMAVLRPFGGFHAAEIAAEVTARIAAGDARIFYVDTTGWLVAADYTDGIHPNVEGSAKAAQALTAVILGKKVF